MSFARKAGVKRSNKRRRPCRPAGGALVVPRAGRTNPRAGTIAGMPVISCPDCGRDVSTIATACPHCGRPSPAGTAPLMSAPQAAAREETMWEGSPSQTLLAGHFFGIVVVLIGVPLLTHFFASSMEDADKAAGMI